MSTPDILVIGGGAAGLSACATARAFGLSVEVVDERPLPGGNFYAGIADSTIDKTKIGHEYESGIALLERAGNKALSPATLAWRVERDGRTIVYSDQAGVRSILPKRLLIATGAMERPVPIPGALLPGVMYAGAAQLMLKSAGSVPAGRSVLVGSGPLLLLLASQLIAFGALPAAIIETTPRVGLGAAGRGLPSALNAPALLLKGLGLLRSIARSGVPRYRHATEVSVTGCERAQGVTFRDEDGKVQSITADLVLVHDGVIPNDQVTRQLGCREAWNRTQHSFAPVIGPWGETSLPGIFAAGDCTGIWGARAAELSGEIAVLEIARQLGRISEAERDRRVRSARRQLARQRAFRPFLESRFPPGLSRAGEAAADTVICRCETVTAGEIRRAVAQGATGPDQLKSFTRCGMGPCQGRSCALAVAEIMAKELSRTVPDIGRHDIRAPLKPVPLGSIGEAEVQVEAVP